MARGSKSVVILSDMHVGSGFAVCTKEPTVGDSGGAWKPNKLQNKLLDAWYWARDSLAQKPHVLVINGEPIDGPNSKQLGHTCWSTNIHDQLKDAEKLIREYRYNNLVMTRGSGYHIQRDATNHEEFLADWLNATPYSGYFSQTEIDGLKLFQDEQEGLKNVKAKKEVQKPEGPKSSRTDYYLWFDVLGKLFSITHHVDFNKWAAYRTTALAREMAGIVFEKGKYYDDNRDVNFIIRSHVHYYVGVKFSNSYGATTPAWKFPDPHLFRGGMAGTAPSIGCLELIIEPNGEYIDRPHILTSKYYPKPRVLQF